MDTLLLKITRIETVVTDAILVYLEEVNSQPVPYEAGQFLTFIIDHYGREIRRSYSIFTTTGIDEEIGVVIKRRVNGEISRYLIDHLRLGDVLTSLHPAGRFTLSTFPHEQRTVFFISAGSGISPVYSLLKKLLYFENLSRAILIYQNRDEASIIFGKELELLQERFAQRFVQINLLSNPIKKRPQRLNNSLLEELIFLHSRNHPPNAFFICGPYNFMRMAEFVIKLMGFKDEHIRKENFVIDAPPPPPFFTDWSTKNVLLRWKGGVFHFTVAYPVNILQAALNNNLHLPYSCRGGRCSTCTVKCISGKVKMSINEVLTDKDLREGFILTCVGFAETDLVLEL